MKEDEIREDNIKLINENNMLREENIYLKTILDKLIPIPVNYGIDDLSIQINNIRDRIRKLEDKK